MPGEETKDLLDYVKHIYQTYIIISDISNRRESPKHFIFLFSSEMLHDNALWIFPKRKNVLIHNWMCLSDMSFLILTIIMSSEFSF